MKQLKRIPVTKEGFENLKLELERLQSERPQAVKTLSEARALGDLSENGLYTAAKARLRSIDSQIFRLETQIKLADIKSGENKDTVGIGSKVTVEENKNTKIYYIVGDFEADPKDNKISQHSPLGQALMGKKAGETVYFEAPKGKIEFKIKIIS